MVKGLLIPIQVGVLMFRDYRIVKTTFASTGVVYFNATIQGKLNS